MGYVAWAAYEECDFRDLSAATSSIVDFQNKSVREESWVRYLAWTLIEVPTEKDKVTFVLATELEIFQPFGECHQNNIWVVGVISESQRV